MTYVVCNTQQRHCQAFFHLCQVSLALCQLLDSGSVITQLNKHDGDEVLEVQLLGIFLRYKDDEYIVGLAGQKLMMLSEESKCNAEIILFGSNDYVDEIVTLLCSTDRMKSPKYAKLEF